MLLTTFVLREVSEVFLFSIGIVLLILDTIKVSDLHGTFTITLIQTGFR